MVSDFKKICKLDMVLMCKYQKNWIDKEELEKIRFQHEALKPALGTFIISKEAIPRQALIDSLTEQNIHFLTVGFNQLTLEPIINALT